MPAGVTAAALAAAAGATGAVTNLETHQIFDRDEQATIVKQADVALKAYRPPTCLLYTSPSPRD